MKVYGNMRDSHKSAANVIIGGLLATSALQGKPCSREDHLPADADMLIQWGFKPTPSLKSAVARKIPYVIVDMGYWEGQRDARQSISFNGLHGGGLKIDVLDRPPRYHPELQPPRMDGEYVLIIGQLAGDASLRGENPETWMRKTAGKAIALYRRPVILRPHPRMLNPWEPVSEPLEDALENAYACVTHTSTCAVTALRMGVRTVATHWGSPVYGLASMQLSSFHNPGRIARFHRLSWHDYNLADLEERETAGAFIKDSYSQAKLAASAGTLEVPGAKL